MASDHVALFVDESFRQLNAGSIKSDPNPSRREQIELALLLENAPAFIELTNNLPSDDLDLDDELEEICLNMFHWDSAKCATAVLDGQTQITKLPFAKMTKLPLAISRLSEIINFPLHRAARYGAFKIAALLLQRGFSADVRADCDAHEQVFQLYDSESHEQFSNVVLPLHDYEAHEHSTNVLPLHVSLAELRFHLLRSLPREKQLSAIMLVIKLCELPVGWFSTLLAQSLIEDAGFDVKYIHYKHDYTRSQVVSYFLKRAIDECVAIDERENTIHTSDILPSWVKKAALRGLRDTSVSTSDLAYPFPETLPYVNNNPMPANMMPLHHLLKKTAPFLGTIKRMFRRG